MNHNHKSSTLPPAQQTAEPNLTPEELSRKKFQSKIEQPFHSENKGNYKSLSSLFVLALIISFLYLGFRYKGEALLKEAWYQIVTKNLVQKSNLFPHSNNKGIHIKEIAENNHKNIWLGATRPELPQSLSGIYRLSEMFHRDMDIVSFYQAWGKGELHEFPRTAMNNMHKGGFVPMVTWEPWLSAFPRWQGENPLSSLDTITSGAVEDYIRQWAREAVIYRKPFFLRLAHEPTNPLYGWAPEYGNDVKSYQKFWNYVQHIFAEEGARNVVWIWTPFGLRDHDWFPGAEKVSYIGLDIFNYGTLVERGEWLDFYTLAKLQIDSYKSLNVPIIGAEVGTSNAGGSKADWWKQALRSIENGDFPELQGLVIFDIPGGETPTGLPLDWSISNNEELKAHLERTK